MKVLKTHFILGQHSYPEKTSLLNLTESQKGNLIE